jgi:tetratricopeptide (TPR) repeat protein
MINKISAFFPVVFFLSALFSPGFLSAQKKVQAAPVDSVSIYLDSGRYEDAVRLIDPLIKKKPYQADLYILRGLARIELSELDSASADFRKSLRLKAKNDTAYYNLGYIEFLKGNYGTAIAYYDSAILYNPKGIYYYVARGDAFLEAGSYPLAAEDYHKAIEAGEHMGTAYFGLGLVYLNSAMTDSARYYFSLAIVEDPFDDEYYYQRGIARYSQGDLDGALKDFDMAISLNEENTKALYARAELYIEYGDLIQALKDLDSALQYDTLYNPGTSPDELEMINERGKILLTLEMYPDAVRDFSKILSTDPDLDVTRYNRALAWYHMGEYEKAKKDLDAAIEINPAEKDYYSYRGAALVMAGDTAAGFADFRKALKIAPNDADIYMLRSSVYADKGMYNAALADLQKVFKIDPEYPDLFLNMGKIYAETGETEEAMKYYDLAILSDRENPEIFFHRGILLYNLDNLQGALEDFDYAIELDPNVPNVYTNRGYVKMEMNDKAGACADWKKAFQLGSAEAQKLLKQHCR